VSDIDYRGMSYEAASREAARLIGEAQKTGRWYTLPEQLKQLRDIMQAQIRCRKTSDMFAT
jgi:hypothetical protein